MPGVVVAIIWQWIYQPVFGILNAALGREVDPVLIRLRPFSDRQRARDVTAFRGRPPDGRPQTVLSISNMQAPQETPT
jgi:ABC-type sugar transport system permease subunit